MTTEQATKQELAALLRPVFDLIWSQESGKENDSSTFNKKDAGCEDDVDKMKGLWLDFFHSRDITRLVQLGMFDAEHFRILQNVYDEHKPTRLSMLAAHKSENLLVISKLTKLCFFIYEFGAEKFLDLAQSTEKNQAEKWREIHDKISTTLYPFDKRSQEYSNARAELRFLFTGPSPHEMLKDPDLRDKWHDCRIERILVNFPLLAGEPCLPSSTYYPFCHLLWSGFSGRILKGVHRIFPKVMCYTQEQGSIVHYVKDVFPEQVTLPQDAFDTLVELHPPKVAVEILQGLDPAMKYSLFELLFQYYRHELVELWLIGKSGIFLVAAENHKERPRQNRMETNNSGGRDQICTLLNHTESREVTNYVFDRVLKLTQLERLLVSHSKVSWFPLLQQAVSGLPCLKMFKLLPTTTPVHDITDLIVSLLQNPTLHNLIVHGAQKKNQPTNYRIKVVEVCEALKHKPNLISLWIRLVSLEGANISKSFLKAIQESKNTSLDTFGVFDEEAKVYFGGNEWDSALNEPGFVMDNYSTAEKMRYLPSLNRWLPLERLQTNNFSPWSVIEAIEWAQEEYKMEIDKYFLEHLCVMAKQPEGAETEIYKLLHESLNDNDTSTDNKWYDYPKIGDAFLGVIFGLLRQASSLWDLQKRQTPGKCLKRKRDEISPSSSF